MEEPVHTIRGKYLDNFQGQYTGSTGWFNIDHEWLKRKFSTLEPDAAPEVGGRATSVHHVLSSGGPDSPPFGGKELGFVRGDVQEDVGGTCGFPKAYNRAEVGETGGRDLVAGGSIGGP